MMLFQRQTVIPTRAGERSDIMSVKTNIPRKEIIQQLSEQYPAGTRVELLEMDDLQAPPFGTQGTVIGVDDFANIMVQWDNGSGLSLIYGEDRNRKI